MPPWLKHATVWLILALGLFLGVQAWQAQQRPLAVVGEVGELADHDALAVLVDQKP
jgi:hypothetical protein